VAVSESVRREAVTAYLSGAASREQVARQYGMSVGSLDRFVARHRYAEGQAPPSSTYSPEELESLRGKLDQSGPMSAVQAQQFLAQRTGKTVSVSTAEHLLHLVRSIQPGSALPVSPPKPSPKAAKVVQAPKSAKTAKKTKAVRPPQPPKPPKKAAYRAAHRRDTPDRYPTDLTDAEWEVLQPHFAPKGGKGSKGGRPPDHTARRMLDAIFYVVRSGCSWRMLPHDFPPWKSVYATFRRWMADGRLQTAHEALRRTLRTRLGRHEDPSALIVDSQSVKTTEKGGLTATTPERR
jgi:transposase/transposase-like protein